MLPVTLMATRPTSDFDDAEPLAGERELYAGWRWSRPYPVLVFTRTSISRLAKMRSRRI